MIKFLIGVKRLRGVAVAMDNFPLCPFDGKPCFRFGVCDVSFFVGRKIEDVGRCPRFNVEVSKKRMERSDMSNV